MIPFETLVLFAATTTALIISPGPDTLNVLRRALSGGRGLGLAAVAGVQFGLLGHTALAVLGISALIASQPAALQAVALAGAAYLAWLGLQGFRGPGVVRLEDGGGAAPAAPARPAATAAPAKAFREACLVNLLNPKVIMLYLALYPNFIDAGRDDVGAQLIFLSAVMIAVNTVWQGGLVLAVNPMRALLSDPRAARAVNRGAGALLLVFAGLMIADHLL